MLLVDHDAEPLFVVLGGGLRGRRSNICSHKPQDARRPSHRTDSVGRWSAFDAAARMVHIRFQVLVLCLGNCPDSELAQPV